jgi:signal transduction histidine kinase/ligand-binding sensor domain-containing protein
MQRRKQLRISVNPLEKQHPNFVAMAKMLKNSRSLSLCFLCLLFAVSSGWAVDPHRHISQYAHSVWRTKDGVFNGSPIVVTQTTDGYLWIGTNTGLVRFDGVRFSSWNPPAGKRLLDPRIFSLLGTHDGSLWIGTGYGISHWKDGELVNYPQLNGRIESVVEDTDGAVWLVRTQSTDGMGPLCRIKDEQLRCYGVTDGIPFPLAIRLERGNSGELWVGGYSELCRWKPGSSSTYFSSVSRRPETFASLKGIATGTDGSVWAAIDRSGPVLQLEHFEHEKWASRSFPGIAVNNSDVTTMFVDREDAVWIGTAHHGVFRARGNDIDHFGSTDGLSSDAVGRFYQDAEGTIWVVTSEGIDNFRDLQVATYSMREGLTAAGASSVLAARDGTVWIGNFGGLDFLRDGKLSAIRSGHGLPGLNVTTLFEDHAGRLWAGVDSGLWVYDGSAFRAVRHADGSALGIIFAITEDVHHNIWVRAGPNLDRIYDLRLQDEFTSSQISTAYTLAANPRGGIVLGLVNGDLVQYLDVKTQTFPANEVGNTRQIRDLLVESDGSVWGTTLDEVARWKDGERKNLTMQNGLPCDGIFALVKDRQGTLWLYSQCGLIAIEESELESWWEHPQDLVKFKLFSAYDGVQPGLTSLKPQAARSPDGRLWFVNGHVLQMIDPEHLQRNVIPPPVNIEGVVADRKSYSLRRDLRLPALTRDLEIDYAALSFVVPQKVRFRYRLEGRDAGWQEPGVRRQAFYSDLPPGKYQFRVIACNNDGIWNEAGATLNFSVAPAWYQTNWFRLLCVVSGLFIAWGFYRLRVRKVTAAITARFDERLAERTRVARELHDTFLQTIQGSKLVADDALDSSTDPVRMRRAIEQLSVWLGQAMKEGRAALNSLRTSTTQTNDLAQALRRATADGLMPRSMAVVFSITGDTREMHPIVRDEVYRIGYEAIRNACVHSAASQLEVGLAYGQDLILRVSDNGAGIDPAVASRGVEGHFGLQGMRERAARIGGKLLLVSSTTSGTEVKLVVPGSIIYRKTDSGRRKLPEKIMAVLKRIGLTSNPD